MSACQPFICISVLSTGRAGTKCHMVCNMKAQITSVLATTSRSVTLLNCQQHEKCFECSHATPKLEEMHHAFKTESLARAIALKRTWQKKTLIFPPTQRVSSFLQKNMVLSSQCNHYSILLSITMN